MLANAVFNYAAQGLLAIAGLVTLPFLLERMGPELYAFVAIYFTVQTVFSILDGGLSGSLAREFALLRHAPSSIASGRGLLRRAEPFYVGLAFTGFATMWALSTTIADQWFRVSSIDRAEASHFIGIIGAIAAIRLATGLYRSVLVGYERQKALSLIDIGCTCIRYGFVLPFMDHFGVDGYLYFCYQLGLAVLEAVALRTCAVVATRPYEEQARIPAGVPPSLRSIFHRSTQIWVLSIIWVLVTQMDKVLLSGTLALKEFGYFSVVSVLTSGILMLGSPIVAAAMPRLAAYHQSAQWEAFKAMYLRACVLLASVATPVCLTLAASPAHAMFLLTHDASVSHRYAGVLACYAFGGLMLLLSGSTFLLQYAAGRLGANIRVNAAFLVLLATSMLFGVYYRAAEGAAVAWLLVNLLQVTFIIRPLNQISGVSVHGQWLRAVIIWPLLVSAPWLSVAVLIEPGLDTRTTSFSWLLVTAMAFTLPMIWRLRTWPAALRTSGPGGGALPHVPDDPFS